MLYSSVRVSGITGFSGSLQAERAGHVECRDLKKVRLAVAPEHAHAAAAAALAAVGGWMCDRVYVHTDASHGCVSLL